MTQEYCDVCDVWRFGRGGQLEAQGESSGTQSHERAWLRMAFYFIVRPGEFLASDKVSLLEYGGGMTRFSRVSSHFLNIIGCLMNFVMKRNVGVVDFFRGNN